MGWPYHFLELSQDEKHLRRQVLDRYGSYAQFSVLVPVALFLLYRLALWTAKARIGRRAAYDVIPNSPSLKVQRQSGLGAWTRQLRKIQWWLGEDVILFDQIYGQRDQWIGGFAWSSWLLLLCVLGTGHGKCPSSVSRLQVLLGRDAQSW
jgi:hypothetical protein